MPASHARVASTRRLVHRRAHLVQPDTLHIIQAPPLVPLAHLAITNRKREARALTPAPRESTRNTPRPHAHLVLKDTPPALEVQVVIKLLFVQQGNITLEMNGHA